MREEELGSGMETDLNEVEMAIEETVEKESLAESETVSNSTIKKADNAKATEMRNRAMENMSSTQKRNSTSRKQKDDDDDEIEDKPKKTRESDTIAYREKNEMMQQMKMVELEIHKQRTEAGNKKQDEVRQHHADLNESPDAAKQTTRSNASISANVCIHAPVTKPYSNENVRKK